MKHNQVAEIESGKYEGYLWKSDQTAPEKIQGTFARVFDEKENPFIVEGLLYDAQRKVSFSIKYVDGHYLVNRFELDAHDFEEGTVQTFLGNRLNANLRFLELYEDQPDPLCEGFMVSVPSACIFIEFLN